MRIVVLGSTGATGHRVVSTALRRGHQVIALARRPDALSGVTHENLRVRQADVHDPGTVTAACRNADALISALGIRGGWLGTQKGERTDTLSAGATAVIRADVPRITWLGSLGAGHSADRVGPLYRAVLRRVLGNGYDDKEAADAVISSLHTTVFHPGMLTDGPATGRAHVVPLDALNRRWRFIPPRVSRGDVATAMISEIENPCFAGQTVVMF